MTRHEIIKAEFERMEKVYKDLEDKKAAEFATITRQQKRRAKKKESTLDRWANGNQYGSFNSDED
jgi:hypothetical protein